tara:strand:+ start:459 stop:704 length:246 start_codon:yes stop_codon:yes gene_type:complete
MYYIVVTNKGGGRFAENARTECEAFVYLNTHKNRGAQSVDIYREPVWNTTEEKSLVAFYGNGSYWDNLSKKKESLNKKRIN